MTAAPGKLRFIFHGLLLATLLIAAPAIAENQTTAVKASVQTDVLVVNASGFKHDRGVAVANLFREGEDIFRKPSIRVMANISNGKAVFAIPDLKYGTYAVTVFHDENGNGDLDHNMFHMPAEPLGFSNGFKMSLVSGLPSFEKLKFAFAPGGKPLDITVR